ncbi:unnamed protein product [Symbiodinium sp. KB8]|nr:unnamed protein product [Symbiodinium sp. KB8]
MTIGEIDIKDYFDQETLEALEKAFLEFDTSGDGSIGKDELRDLFAKLGKTLTKKQVDAIVREIDSDGNGEIDFEELCYLEIVMSGARPQAHLIDYKTFLPEKTTKQLEEWFSLNDMDDSGTISIDDALKIAEQQDVKVSMDDVTALLSEVKSAADGWLNLPSFCALWTCMTNAQKIINYREYLEAEEVAAYRAMFQEACEGGKEELNRKQVSDVLRNTGLVRVRRHLTRIWEEMAIDKKTMLDFAQFCVVIVRLMKRRKYREVNPQTCTCARLYEEGFTVKELLMSGFKLKDFEAIRLKGFGWVNCSEHRELCEVSAAKLTWGGVFSNKDPKTFQRVTMTPLIREHTDGRHTLGFSLVTLALGFSRVYYLAQHC